MRLAPAARRTVATVAATALVSAGGVLTGVLVGVASAQTLNGVTPTAPLNNGSTTFTLSGSGFSTPSAESVVLHKVSTATGQADIPGTVCNTATCVAAASALTGATLTFTADLTNAAPGPYDVVVTNNAAVPAEKDYVYGGVTITAVGNPTLTSVAKYDAGAAPTDGKLEIIGTNLSKGSTVDFLKPDGTVDTGMSFTPVVDGATGYVSSTTLRGRYDGSGATPGLHQLRVTSTTGQVSNTLAFYQPVLTGVSQPTIGQGATQTPFAVTGQGFNPSSTYTISTPTTTPPSTPDVTVTGPSAVTATSVTEQVTVTAAAATTARTLTVRGPDGGYATRSDLLSISAGPTFSAGPPLATAPLNPSKGGQGSNADVTVTGTGFTAGTTFDFGPGTGSPRPVKTFTSSTSVVVTVPVDATATPGTRNVVALNPDDGTSTLANGYTVTAAPTITRLSPASGNRGQTAVSTIVYGAGFVSGDSYSLTFSGNAGDVTTGTVHYVNASQLSAAVSVASAAASGPRDVTITDTTDGGTTTCAACFSINSLGVTPGSVTNTGVTTLTLTGSGLVGTSTVRLYLPGQPTPAYQADIAGTGVVANGTDSIKADVDLTDVATGVYTVETTTGTSVLTCTGCLTVQAVSAPAINTITPAFGGQGATARQVRIDGSYLFPGTTVTFSGPGVTATGVTWHPADANNPAPYLTASVAITKSATVNTSVTGARDVVVTNIGDGKQGTLAKAFTVDQRPLPTAISPTVLGQGAVRDVTVTGSRFQDGSTADFGPGTSSVLKSFSGDSAAGPTTLVFTVTVALNAPTGTHDLTVTAPDDGQETLAGALTVTSAPVASAVTPSVAAPGTTRTVTVDATGLQQGVTVAVGDLTVGSATLAQDGHSLTVSVTVPAGASLGKRTVVLTNPDGGTSTFGSTSGQSGFVVATVPAAPTGVTVTTGNGTATVTWSAPSTDGGSPVTSYTADDGDSSTPNAVVVPAGHALTASFSGLTNGRTYTFTVRATNAVGTGAAGTRQGTPYTVPSAPASVTATPQDAQATVAWTPAAGNGSGVTGYVVHEASGKVPDVTVGAVTSTVVTGLTNGTAYSFQVRARNAAGSGAFSAPSAAVTPRFATVLTSLRSPASSTTAGTTVRYYGHLSRRSSGAAVAGGHLALTLKPDVGATVTKYLVTDASGNWYFYAAPVYNTTTGVRFGGDADDAPVVAASYKKLVSVKVTVTSPRSGTSSAASTTLVVSGATSPNKAGRTVGIYRELSPGRLQLVAKAVVASNGTYRVSLKLARGTYELRAGLGTTTGNSSGYSALFKVIRT